MGEGSRIEYECEVVTGVGRLEILEGEASSNERCRRVYNLENQAAWGAEDSTIREDQVDGRRTAEPKREGCLAIATVQWKDFHVGFCRQPSLSPIAVPCPIPATLGALGSPTGISAGKVTPAP